MCGIVGIFPAKLEGCTVPQKTREASIRYLTTEMLLRTEDRGRDASGLFVHLQAGEFFWVKQPVPAAEFIQNIGQSKYEGQDVNHSFRAVNQKWRLAAETKSPTATVFAHARKGTKGSEYKPENNHPICIDGRIIGVHNGKIDNDDKIFKNRPELKRLGEVDSEAIFQLHHALAPDTIPTLELAKEMDRRLRGEYTFLSTNTLFPGVTIGIKRSRPLEVVFCKDLGLIILVSEKKAADGAIDAYNRMAVSMSIKIPRISDCTSRFMTDTYAFMVDTRNPVKTLEECCSDVTLYNIDKIPAYDTASVAKYTHTPVASTYTPPQAPKKAKIQDLTTYPKKEEVVPFQGPPVKDTHGNLVVFGDGEDSTTTDEGADEKRQLEYLVKEGIEIFESRMEDTFFWPSRIDSTEKLRNMFDIPSKVPVEDTTLLNLVGAVYQVGLGEGYAMGMVKAAAEAEETEGIGETVDAGTLKQMQQMIRKQNALIANCKTYIMALAIIGDVAIENSEEGPPIIFDQVGEKLARRINRKFDPRKAYNLFSTDKDKRTFVRFLDEWADYKDAEDEDDGDGEDESGEEEQSNMLAEEKVKEQLAQG